ncbi:hypothetical protein [Actinomadura sp. KC216]|uniref:hypothetical protein n=1 Tax=Actinomadura sp. KC216 TaxID=2530370 RepID=UPI001A9F54CD|nr:hypothetical protein [Actinomadura sp. KC216]
MAVVVIQPSYGNPASRRRWADTMGQEVAFTASAHESRLTEAQKQSLLGLHPSGRARFWGATSFQNSKMKRVHFGDVVLFTGLNKVRGIGEVGVLFDNPAFADTLWSPEPDKGSWNNVYSLVSFQATEIDYEEIWALPGFNQGDNFMGLRILEGDKAEVLLQGLGIVTSTGFQEDLMREAEVLQALTDHTQVVDLERIHTTQTSFRSVAREIRVRRAEALLVRELRHQPSQSPCRPPANPGGYYGHPRDRAGWYRDRRSQE